MKQERYEQLFQMLKMFERWEASTLYLGRYKNTVNAYQIVPRESHELAMEDLRVMIGKDEFDEFQSKLKENKTKND